MKNNLIPAALLCFLSASIFASNTGNLTQTVTDFYAAIDAGNDNKVASMLADDVKITLPFSPQAMDKNSYQQLRVGLWAAFPNMQHKVLETVVGKNAVAYKALFSGTNSGPFKGNPPSSNEVEQPFIGIMQFDAKGKIKMMDIMFDVALFNAQLMKGINPVEMNKQAALRIMESLDKRDLDGALAAYAPGAKFNGWAPPQLDANGYKGVMGGLLAAFPDSHFTVDDVVAEGDQVVVRHHFEGTHTGSDFQGAKPAGKKVFATATVTFQMQNGKPVELWLNADFLGILMQIGAVPAPKS